MKLIVITAPEFIRDETLAISSLFDAGLEILHLRKPASSVDELRNFLNQIPGNYLDRIVVHEHFSLKDEFHLKGIHLNRRNALVPNGYTGHTSCSCHSLEEVEKKKDYFDYLFLSPIFDSISKEGYSSNFSENELKIASQNGVIDSKVMALGGINYENIRKVEEMGFGGAAVLGHIWKPSSEIDVASVVDSYLKLKNSINI